MSNYPTNEFSLEAIRARQRNRPEWGLGQRERDIQALLDIIDLQAIELEELRAERTEAGQTPGR